MVPTSPMEVSSKVKRRLVRGVMKTLCFDAFDIGDTTTRPCREREFFMDNLLVRIHLIIEMILVDRPCAMRV